MGTSVGIGSSVATDPRVAGAEVARQALCQLGERPPDVALLFATAAYDQGALLEAIREVTGDLRISGCSGEGVIVEDASREVPHAVAMMAVASDSIRFDTLLVRSYAEDPAQAGQELAAAVREIPDPRVLVVLPDGLLGNCTLFIDALAQAAPPDLSIVGGTAADDFNFQQTYQYHDSEAATGAVAALVLSGDVVAEVSVSHGCVPIGLPRKVTRAKDGWVHEMDGRPAWEVFKEYLDGDPQDLNAEGIVHLCIGQPLEDAEADDYDRHIIRTPMRLDKETGSLFFPGGGLGEGQVVQLTRRDPQKIRTSAEACAQRILGRGHPGVPEMVLQFDCAGRGRILFGSCAAREIVEPLRQTLGNTPWLGFHTYGEIAEIGGKPYFHNYTVALCAIYRA